MTPQHKTRETHISRTCLVGAGHFNKCAKSDCTCLCHELDGEIGKKERTSMRRAKPA